jgi:hypothetical protein
VRPASEHRVGAVAYVPKESRAAEAAVARTVGTARKLRRHRLPCTSEKGSNGDAWTQVRAVTW